LCHRRRTSKLKEVAKIPPFLKVSTLLQSATAGADDSCEGPSAGEANLNHPARSRLTRAKLMWVAVLTALGVVGMAPTLLRLWDVWTDDPLKSLGMLIVPASVVLTLRLWRQMGWELRGTWWGLLPLGLGLFLSGFHRLLAWTLIVGPLTFNLLSPKIALYLFGSGIVLLFGGIRVWRQAWFPIALLLCAQPVPTPALQYVDLPLQDLSAHVARSFAVLIGFPPTSKELLRLMFTPDFGMFIAPGCDGVRGALTLGYVGLITGYLKRVSPLRWIFYVVGGVFLGYLFNLIRLCALVVYYRVAAGHPRLEDIAKQADYVIGGCLFLIAALFFLWVVTRKEGAGGESVVPRSSSGELSSGERRLFVWRAAACAFLALAFAVPGVNAIRTHRRSFSAAVRDGRITEASLDSLMPEKLGSYTRSRAWQEAVNGSTDIESAAYVDSSGEFILGVWLPANAHNMHDSWMARGEDPRTRGNRTFATAFGQPVQFDTAFYSDGITDSFAGNADCTPAGCIASQPRPKLKMQFVLHPADFNQPGNRAVPIFFRVDRPHGAEAPSAVDQELTAEAQQYLAGVDFAELSRRFQ